MLSPCGVLNPHFSHSRARRPFQSVVTITLHIPNPPVDPTVPCGQPEEDAVYIGFEVQADSVESSHLPHLVQEGHFPEPINQCRIVYPHRRIPQYFNPSISHPSHAQKGLDACSIAQATSSNRVQEGGSSHSITVLLTFAEGRSNLTAFIAAFSF